MIRPEFKKTLLEQQGVTVVLWSLFIVFIIMYIAIAQFVLQNPKFAGGFAFAPAARAALWTLVLVDLYYLWRWKTRYLTRGAIMDDSKRSKLLRALEGHKTPTEERAAIAVSTYVTKKIVAFAIVEAIAVYGLVLALIGPFLWDQYLFSAVSGALLMIEFPSKGALEELVKEFDGQE